jgi:hypothetical protein
MRGTNFAVVLQILGLYLGPGFEHPSWLVLYRQCALAFFIAAPAYHVSSIMATH